MSEITLDRRAVQLLGHQDRVRQAVDAGSLHKLDARLSLTTAVVRFAFALENDLERLFFDYVLGRRRQSEVVPRVVFRSRSMLSEHLHSGKKYLNWLPYDHTVERAKLYLRGGRPFSELSPTARRGFEELTLVRNVLAHESDHARTKFKNGVVASGVRVVPVQEQRVESYLLGESSPGVSRLESHLQTCVQGFRELI